MNLLASRLSKLRQSFKNHVMKNYKEGLVPKLLSNVNLSTDCIELTKKKVLEQEDFLKFHENLAARHYVVNDDYHCLTVSTSRENLVKHNVHFKEVPFTCDCGLDFYLAVPLNQDLQEDDVSLANSLTAGVLDSMCQSTYSSPSPGQPDHGSFVLTAMPMWTMDPRARQNINEACELLQFNRLPVLCDIRARPLLSVCDYECASTEEAHLNFKDALSKMYVKSNGDKEFF